MTSNIGADILNRKEKEIGFINHNENFLNEDIKKDVLKEVNKSFKKEFLNRIDEIIIFNKLKKDDVKKIIEKYILDLIRRFKKSSYNININENIIDFILNKCQLNQNGARDIKRILKNLIENKIVEKIINNNLEKESNINIYVDKENNLIVE